MIPEALRIAIDFDDTISNTHEIILALINFKLDTHITKEDISEWNFWQMKPDGKDINKVFWEVHDLMETTYIRRAIRPIPYATDVIKSIKEMGCIVEVITMNNDRAKKNIEAWLFMHGLEIPVYTQGRGSPGDKVKLDYDIFIDDSPRLIERMKKFPEKHLILFTQPWNKEIDISKYKNINRCNNWLEILSFINNYINMQGD